MSKMSQYRGVTLINGNWRAQIVVNGTAHYIGSFPNETFAAQAFDEVVHELAKAGRERHIKLNFPERYNGDRTLPEPSEKTLEIVRLFKESGVPRKPTMGAVSNESNARASLNKAYILLARSERTLTQLRQEANEHLDRLAETLFFLGDPSPLNERQALHNLPPATSETAPVFSSTKICLKCEKDCTDVDGNSSCCGVSLTETGDV